MAANPEGRGSNKFSPIRDYSRSFAGNNSVWGRSDENLLVQQVLRDVKEMT
jgi:hypothetical protein